MAQLTLPARTTVARSMRVGLLRTVGFVAFLCLASVLLDRLT